MKYKKSVFHAAAMITQFGIHMLVPIFLCTFAGIYADGKLGTRWITVALFFVGAMAGGRNIYVFAKRIADMDSDTRNRALASNVKQGEMKEQGKLEDEEED